jgi:hypothetical protein
MTRIDAQSSRSCSTGDRLKLPVVFAAILVTVMAFGSSAAAQSNSEVSGNVNLKFGPYYPAVDEEFSDATPFADAFGSNSRVLGQLDAEYYLWQGHGKLGLGVTVGYTNFTGSSQIQGTGEDSGGNGGDGGDGSGGDGGGDNGGGDGSSDDSVNLEEETKFRVFPLGLIASYRWDYLVEELNVPLALKGEAGLDYYLWRVKDGSGDISEADGQKAAGAVPGYHLAGRVEFLLNAVDPETAAAFDLSWGINRTYLFGEYNFSKVDGFGSDSLRLGDSTWKIGLAFEF